VTTTNTNTNTNTNNPTNAFINPLMLTPPRAPLRSSSADGATFVINEWTINRSLATTTTTTTQGQQGDGGGGGGGVASLSSLSGDKHRKVLSDGDVSNM